MESSDAPVGPDLESEELLGVRGIVPVGPEGVVVPVLQGPVVPLSEGRRQVLAVELHGDVPVHGAAVGAGIALELQSRRRVRNPAVFDFLGLLPSLLLEPLPPLEHLVAPGGTLPVLHPVDEPVSQRADEGVRPTQVDEHHEAVVPLGHEGDEGRHAIDVTAVGDHLQVPVVREEPPETVREEIGGREDEPPGPFLPHDHLTRVHLCHGFLGDEALPFVLAHPQLEPDPLSHLQCAGVDGSRGPRVVDVPVGNGLQAPVRQLDVGSRHVLHVLQGLHRRAATGHPEGGEEASVQVLVPRLPGPGLDDLARRDPHDVVVLERGPEGERHGLVPGLMEDFIRVRPEAYQILSPRRRPELWAIRSRTRICRVT